MLSKIPNDSIDVTIRHLTSTIHFPDFCFREWKHLVNGIFQKKISTFPKFQFVKVDGAIPIASVDFGAGNGGFGKPHPNEFGKGSSLVLNELHHDNMP